MNKPVKPSSLWQSRDNSHSRFQVIHVITDEQGHEWVHYRRVAPDHCEEYSCWTESFLARFQEIVNESHKA